MVSVSQKQQEEFFLSINLALKFYNRKNLEDMLEEWLFLMPACINKKYTPPLKTFQILRAFF